MGFLASGVPLPLCLAFLTSASCMNLTALTTLFAQMDLRFSALYLACCLAICALSSVLVGARGAEGLVRLDKLHAEHHHHHDENTARSRLVKALCSAWLTFRSVWPFLLLGVAASAALSAFVPQEWISRALTGNPLALPLAAILGGCLHSDVFSILPIVQTIYAYSPAVSLTFLLSVMLFSIAEWALLTRVPAQSSSRATARRCCSWRCAAGSWRCSCCRAQRGPRNRPVPGAALHHGRASSHLSPSSIRRAGSVPWPPSNHCKRTFSAPRRSATVRLAHAVAHAGIARGADLLLLFAQGEVVPARPARARAPRIDQEPLVPQRGGQRAAQAEGPALAQGVQRHEPAQGIAEDAAVLRPGQQRTARASSSAFARSTSRRRAAAPPAESSPGRMPGSGQGEKSRFQSSGSRAMSAAGRSPSRSAPRQGTEGLGQVHRLLRRPV